MKCNICGFETSPYPFNDGIGIKMCGNDFKKHMESHYPKVKVENNRCYVVKCLDEIVEEDYKKSKEREVARILAEGEAEILRVSKKKSEADEDLRKSMHALVGKSLGKSPQEIEEHWNEVKDDYPNVQLYRLKSKEKST
jgi:hypothetical protein